MADWTRTTGDYLHGLADAIVPPVRRLSIPAVQRAEAAHGRDSIEVAEALDEAGTAYVHHGRWREAQTVWRRSLAIKESQYHPDPRDLALTLARLAHIVSDPTEAESFYRRSIAIYEDAPGPERLGLASALNGLGHFLAGQSRSQEAEPLLRRTVAIYERAPGRGRRRLLEPLIDLALVLLQQSRDVEAERFLRRASIIYENAEGRGPYNRALSLLVNLLDRQSRGDEARLLAKGLRYDEDGTSL